MSDLTIGRVANAAGVNVETVRFYQRRKLLEGKRVALPHRIFRIMSAHSLALTSEGEHGEGRSEVGVLDEADQRLASERAVAKRVLPARRT